MTEEPPPPIDATAAPGAEVRRITDEVTPNYLLAKWLAQVEEIDQLVLITKRKDDQTIYVSWSDMSAKDLSWFHTCLGRMVLSAIDGDDQDGTFTDGEPGPDGV